MLLIGLTGGAGMGKSTVAGFLSERGERVIDTDQIARDLVEPGQPALELIRGEFGEAVIRADGTLDRAALADKAFADAGRRSALEAILHPRIRQEWLRQAAECRGAGAKRAVVVIPLLYETAAENEFGWVACVACSAKMQAGRLRGRGWSDGQIARRNAAQWPVGRKMDLADGVIWNEAGMKVCREQVERLFFGTVSGGGSPDERKI